MTNQFEPQPLIVFDNELADQLGDFANSLEQSVDAIDDVGRDMGTFSNRLHELVAALPTVNSLIADMKDAGAKLERAQAIVEDIIETEGIWTPVQDITDYMWPSYGMSLVEEQRIRDHFLTP